MQTGSRQTKASFKDSLKKVLTLFSSAGKLRRGAWHGLDICLRSFRQSALFRRPEAPRPQLPSLRRNAHQHEHNSFVEFSPNSFARTVRERLRDARIISFKSAGQSGNVENDETVDFQRHDAQIARQTLAQSAARIQAVSVEFAAFGGRSRARSRARSRTFANERFGEFSFHVAFVFNQKRRRSFSQLHFWDSSASRRAHSEVLLSRNRPSKYTSFSSFAAKSARKRINFEEKATSRRIIQPVCSGAEPIHSFSLFSLLRSAGQSGLALHFPLFFEKP